MNEKKEAMIALDVPARKIVSVYPEPFASQMKGRVKRQLGEFFGITKFGINLTVIEPGGKSSLLHRHSKQEEFIYILEGTPTLILEDQEIELAPGMCAGFIPSGSAHQLVNRSSEKAVYLEVGDREVGDEAVYPVDDLKAEKLSDGKWSFTRKNGQPY